MKNICILLLLILNISMGIVLLSRNKKLGELQALLVQQGNDLLLVNKNLEKCYQAFAGMNSHAVQAFLNAAGAGYELVDPANAHALFVLIPPYPCDVCLDKEIHAVQTYFKGKEMVVMAPECRMRDMRAQLQNNRAIKFIPYDMESVKGVPGADLDAVIYFRTDGEVVYDIFIPDRSNTEYSAIYMNELN